MGAAADFEITNAHARDYLARVDGTKAHGTWKIRNRDLRDFEQWREERDLDLAAMTVADLDSYFVGLARDGYAPGTINQRFLSVRCLFNYLDGFRDVIESNPFYDDRGEPVLTAEEYMNGESGARKRAMSELIYAPPEVAEAIAANVASPVSMNELIVRLLWQTGVRAGEATSIRLDDLDRDERRIKIWGEKTGETRTVYYHESLDPLLAQWLDYGGRARFIAAAESPYLFPGEEGPNLPHDHVNAVVTEAAERAGIQEVSFRDQIGRPRHKWTAHSLRHGFAVHYLKNRGNIRALQKLLGHADIDTTMIYLDLIETDVRDDYRANYHPTAATAPA